jgi:catalase
MAQFKGIPQHVEDFPIFSRNIFRSISNEGCRFNKFHFNPVEDPANLLWIEQEEVKRRLAKLREMSPHKI